MSQRDLVAELRAAHVEAPSEVRERVRLIAAGAPAPPRRITWRRALVVVVPVAAAIVFTRPADHPQVVREIAQNTPSTLAPTTHGAATDRSAKAFALPSPTN